MRRPAHAPPPLVSFQHAQDAGELNTPSGVTHISTKTCPGTALGLPDEIKEEQLTKCKV